MMSGSARLRQDIPLRDFLHNFGKKDGSFGHQFFRKQLGFRLSKRIQKIVSGLGQPEWKNGVCIVMSPIKLSLQQFFISEKLGMKINLFIRKSADFKEFGPWHFNRFKGYKNFFYQIRIPSHRVIPFLRIITAA